MVTIGVSETATVYPAGIVFNSIYTSSDLHKMHQICSATVVTLHEILLVR